jgi:hypothetical protein
MASTRFKRLARPAVIAALKAQPLPGVTRHSVRDSCSKVNEMFGRGVASRRKCRQTCAAYDASRQLSRRNRHYIARVPAVSQMRVILA